MLGRSGFRRDLLRSTALLSVLATPAVAQPAPNAHPAGGQVVGGQARITQNATTTTIDQTSQRAALTWQSYDLGNSQTVRYVQPNAQSVALNTVLSANPSLIAGHITANGQIVLVNQSGVVFYKGAQVDTAGLTATATGISRQNFMAGRMVFDQAPHPGALVSNAGNITVGQAGLAALVGPLVRNSGTITATLGQVILGAATTYTLDLYGDGMLTLNVTGLVTQMQIGGARVPALITNTGTILADGGSIVLSAAAVDGLIQTLVNAGGVISAPSAGAQGGRILVQGVGGGIDIDGAVAATGAAPGTKGGAIYASATGTVTLAPGASLDASGAAGGGSVVAGSAPGAATPVNARSVTIARGSTIRADARARGNGGTVTVLATQTLVHDGAISVQGGAAGGNGGAIHLSTPGTLELAGSIDAAAPAGNAGQGAFSGGAVTIGGDLLTSPTCSPNCGTTSTASRSVWEVDSGSSITVTAAVDLYDGRGLTGLILDAKTAIVIQQNLAADSGNAESPNLIDLELIAGGNIDVYRGVTVTAKSVTISAGGSLVNATGGSGSTPGSFSVANGTGTVTVLQTNKTHYDFPLRPNNGGPYPSTPTSIDLLGAFLSLNAWSYSAANGGQYNQAVLTPHSVSVTDSDPLTILAPITASGPISVAVASGDLTVNAALAAATGQVSLTSATGNITESATPGGAVGSIVAGTLIASAANGIALTSTNNVIAALGTITANTALTGAPTGSITLVDNVASLSQPTLTTTGLITTANSKGVFGDIYLNVLGGALSIGADVTALNGSFSALAGIAQTAGTITATAGNLTVSGENGGISLSGVLHTGPAADLLSVNGDISLSANLSILETPGSGDSGRILTGALSANAGGNVSLPNTGNIVEVLNNSSANSNTFLLADSVQLTIAAPVSAGQRNSVAGTIVLEGPSFQTPPTITPITTFIFAPDVSEVEPGGTLTAFSAGRQKGLVAFDLSSEGIFSFGPATLTVSGLGSIAVETLVPSALADIHADQVYLGWHSATQPSNAEALYIDAALDSSVFALTSPRGTVGLFTTTFVGSAVATGVFETDGTHDGSINADTLLGTAYAASLPGSANSVSTNSVGTLGNFTVFGAQTLQGANSSTGTSFAFADNESLSITGTVQQASAGAGSPSTIAISVSGTIAGAPNGLALTTASNAPNGSATSGSILNDNSFSASYTAISLTAAGPITQISNFSQPFSTLSATTGDIHLLAQSADITQTSSVITASSGSVTLTAETGNIFQTNSTIAAAGSGPSQGTLAAYAAGDILQTASTLSATQTATADAGASFSQTSSTITAGILTSIVADQLQSTIVSGTPTYFYPSATGVAQSAGSTIAGGAVTIISGGQVTQAGGSQAGSVIEALANQPGAAGTVLVVLNGDPALPAGSAFAQPDGAQANFTQAAGNTLQSRSGDVAVYTPDGSIALGGLLDAGNILGATFSPNPNGQVLLYAGAGDITETTGGASTGAILAAALAADAPSGNVSFATPLGPPALAENQIGRLLTSADAITLATPAFLVISGGGTQAVSSITGSTQASGSIAINDDARVFTSNGANYNLTDGALLIGTNTRAGSIVAGADVTLKLYGSLVQVEDVLQSQTGSIAITAQAATSPARPVFSILQLAGTLQADTGNITLTADNLIGQGSGSTITAGAATGTGDVLLSAGAEFLQSGASILRASNLVDIVTDEFPPGGSYPSPVGFSQSGASTITAGGTLANGIFSSGSIAIATGGQFLQGAAGDDGGSLIYAAGQDGAQTGDISILLDGRSAAQGAFTQLQGQAAALNTIRSAYGTIAVSTTGQLEFGGLLLAGSLDGTGFTPSQAGEILLSAAGITEIANTQVAAGSGPAQATGVVLAQALAASARGSILLQTPLIGLTSLSYANGSGAPTTTPSATSAENQVGRLLTSADGGISATAGPISTQAGGAFFFTDDARAFNIGAAAPDGGLLVGGAAGNGVLSAGGNLSLTLYGSLLQTNSSIAAGGNADISLLAGETPQKQPITSAFSLMQQNATLSATGSLTVAADALIEQTGSLLSAGGAANLTAGASLLQDASAIIAQKGTISIAAYGDSGTTGVQQSAGSTIQALSSTAAAAVQIVSAGDILQQGENTIAAPGGVTLWLQSQSANAGRFMQTATDLIQSAQGTVAIRSTAGTIAAGGTLLAGTDTGGVFTPSSSGTVLLYADRGDIAESAGGAPTGRILAGALAAQAGGNVLLDTPDQPEGDANRIGQLLTSTDGAVIIGSTPISTRANGTLILNDDATAFAGGMLLLGTAKNAGGMIEAGSDITLWVLGGIAQSGSTLLSKGGNISLSASGAISQAGTSSILSQDDLTIDLTSRSAPSGLFSQASGGLLQTAAGTLGITSDAGNLVLAGTLMAGGTFTAAGIGGIGFSAAPPGSVTLTATLGTLTQAGPSGHFTGSIEAATLQAQAGGSLLLEAASNDFGTLVGTSSGTTLSGAWSLADSASTFDNSLTLAGGTITAANGVSLTVTGSLVQQNNTLAANSGNIVLTAKARLEQNDATLIAAEGSIALAAAGALSQNATSLQAKTGISETSVSAGITLIGSSLTASASGIALSSAASAIDISGTSFAAPLLTQISAAAGSVTLDGVTFQAQNTFGNLLASTAPVPFTAWPQNPGKNGVLIATRSVSIGSNGATLSPFGGAALTGLDIDLTSRGSGTIDFGAAGLIAPHGILLLDLNGGLATGAIATAGLDVLTSGPGISGNAGAANLQGSVKGFASFEAASVSVVSATQANVIAQPSQNLRINDCPLTATDCVLLSPFVPPVYALISDFTVAPPRPDADQDFDLPNVAREDF